MRNDLEQIVKELKVRLADSNSWPTEVNPLLDLTLEGISYYGLTCDEAVIEPLGVFYRHLVKNTTGEDRKQLYLALQKRVFGNDFRFSPNTFFPFMFDEVDCGIVSTAIIDHSMLFQTLNGADLSGIDYLVDIFERAEHLANRGAFFGGLVAIGDQRAMAKLKKVKWTLTPEEVQQATKCGTPQPGLACIEFWIGWMEELIDTPYAETNMFGNCALGLVLMHRQAITGNIFEIERNFGYCNRHGERPMSLSRSVSLEEIHERYSQRMYALEATESVPILMSSVLREYQLPPRAPIQDQYRAEDARGQAH